MLRRRFAAFVSTALAALSGAAFAQTPPPDELFGAVVRLKTFVDAGARSAETLGREREGSGIVIDASGLILTIGYLIAEAHGAEISVGGRTVRAEPIGMDPETGFGLLRAVEPLRVKPMAFGRSADLKTRDPVIVVSFGGPEMAAPALVVSRREFAGAWEYLLDQAIFTAPPHPAWSGAALLNSEGKLVGVGSLIVTDAAGAQAHFPGNMFVPTDLLLPILSDLIVDGRSGNPGKPWLGMSTEEFRGRLFVSRVTKGGPAEAAGIKQGEMVLAIDGETPKNLSDLWKRIRTKGDAGVEVTLTLLGGPTPREVKIKSGDRRDYLKVKSSL